MKNYIRKIKEYEEGGRTMEKDIYGIEACFGGKELKFKSRCVNNGICKWI